MSNLAELINKMTEYESGCPQRIGHFLKVYGYAKTIGEQEKLDAGTQLILEAAAILHDIGIKSSLEKYGSSSGEYQQREGPAVARPILETLGFCEADIDRICFLIGRHHTYTDIDGMDYQILVEADFLVNIDEDGISREAAGKIYEDVFKTETGKRFLGLIYL